MPLLPPSLMARLARLDLATRRRAAGTRVGTRRSVRRGQSQEFADHRPYVPGDDLRFLDWALYGRLDTLWVKLFEEEADRVVHLLLDGSGSMRGDKLRFAREVAAALAFVSLGRSERVLVAGLADRRVHYAPPVRGRGRIGRILDALEAIPSGGRTDLLAALGELPRQRGAGIALLFSDLLFVEPLDAVLKRLRANGGEAWVFHVLSPVDLRPALAGDVILVDRETGAEVSVSVDEEVLDRYEATVRAWADAAEATCRRHGVGYVRAPTTVPVEDLVLRDLRRLGVLS